MVFLLAWTANASKSVATCFDASRRSSVSAATVVGDTGGRSDLSSVQDLQRSLTAVVHSSRRSLFAPSPGTAVEEKNGEAFKVLALVEELFVRCRLLVEDEEVDEEADILAVFCSSSNFTFILSVIFCSFFFFLCLRLKDSFEGIETSLICMQFLRETRLFSSIDPQVSRSLLLFGRRMSSFSFSRIDTINPKPGELVEYLTDVEGNLEYVRKWLRYSKLLQEVSSSSSSALSSALGPSISPSRKRERSEPPSFELDFVSESGYFVFGGDAVDKGPGDIQWTRALISLKKRYPSRVFLILGNRDINKLRFATEVAANVPGDKVEVLWDPSHLTFVGWLAEKQLEASPTGSLNDRINVCKWMLERTMGSATTFELRREELAFLHEQTHPSDITDEMVLASYLESIDRTKSDREAYMLAYLKYGQLALRINSTLVVHGAVHNWNCGLAFNSKEQIKSVDEWTARLNAFAEEEINAFVQSGKDPLDLMAYGVGICPTVVYTTFLENGNGRYPEQETIDYLNANGIVSVLAGHAPHGESPLIMRGKGLTVLTADTSYSDVSSPDNRGQAVSHVTLVDNEIRVVGVDKNSSPHSFSIDTSQPVPTEGHYIGEQLPSSSWIKNYCPTRNQFLAVRGEGFRLFSEWIDP